MGVTGPNSYPLQGGQVLQAQWAGQDSVDFSVNHWAPFYGGAQASRVTATPTHSKLRPRLYGPVRPPCIFHKTCLGVYEPQCVHRSYYLTVYRNCMALSSEPNNGHGLSRENLTGHMAGLADCPWDLVIIYHNMAGCLSRMKKKPGNLN